MPILFEQSNSSQIDEKYQGGMNKLFNEYPFEDLDKFENGFWVYGIFNERVAGAMFINNQNKPYIVEYLAVRKPTQNRGIGREFVNRWPNIKGCDIELSEKLKVVIGDFK